MNEPKEVQPLLDYRTGVPTFIYGGELLPGSLIECGRLNRIRSRGIQATVRADAPGKQVSFDGWISLIVGAARAWGIPLVPLEALGFLMDDAFALSSSELTPMGAGREAMAWLDRSTQSVYKLFDVRPNSTLGHKISFEEDEGNLRVSLCEAMLSDTLEKLCVLHEIGACPTEIVGLSDNGKYLIAKQPRCFPLKHFETDRDAAIETIKAISPHGSYGNEMWVFWAQDQGWCIIDLHDKNLRRTLCGAPTIIDALVSPIPILILETQRRIREAVCNARALREGRITWIISWRPANGAIVPNTTVPSKNGTP